MPDHLHVVEITSNHVICTWHNVLVVIWKHETTSEAVRTIKEAHRALSSRFPKNVFLLTVVEERAPMPPSVVRLAMSDFLDGCAGSVVLSALVHEGTGFRAAAVRSVVTGLATVTHLPYPHKVFPAVDVAARWLETGSPDARTWTAESLIAAVREVRMRFETA